MTESKKEESLPANVYNYTYRILGYDYKKVLGLIVTVVLSSAAVRMNVLLFVAISSVGTILSISTIDGMNPLLFLSRRLRSLGGKKHGVLNSTYRILSISNGAAITDETFIYQFVKVDEATASETDIKEGRNNAISKIISSIESDLDFIFYPVTANTGIYKVEEETSDSEDYNRLIDYVFEGCYYMQSFIVLKRRYKTGKEAIESALLKEESQNLVSLLTASSISCRVVSSLDEIKELLRVVQ